MNEIKAVSHTSFKTFICLLFHVKVLSVMKLLLKLLKSISLWFTLRSKAFVKSLIRKCV